MAEVVKMLTVLLFLIVTWFTPVMTFMPSFSMAFLLFFSLLVCLDLPLASPPSPRKHRRIMSDFQNLQKPRFLQLYIVHFVGYYLQSLKMASVTFIQHLNFSKARLNRNCDCNQVFLVSIVDFGILNKILVLALWVRYKGLAIHIMEIPLSVHTKCIEMIHLPKLYLQNQDFTFRICSYQTKCYSWTFMYMLMQVKIDTRCHLSTYMNIIYKWQEVLKKLYIL